MGRLNLDYERLSQPSNMICPKAKGGLKTRKWKAPQKQRRGGKETEGRDGGFYGHVRLKYSNHEVCKDAADIRPTVNARRSGELDGQDDSLRR